MLFIMLKCLIIYFIVKYNPSNKSKYRSQQMYTFYRIQNIYSDTNKKNKNKLLRLFLTILDYTILFPSNNFMRSNAICILYCAFQATI